MLFNTDRVVSSDLPFKWLAVEFEQKLCPFH